MIVLVLMALALLGMPLFAVIAIGAFAGYHDAELNLGLVAMEFQRIGELSVLIALPLFAFAGIVLARSTTPQRLVEAGRALGGGLSGTTAIVVLAVLAVVALMTALTGAPALIVAALGGVMLPALINAGHSHRFGAGLLGAASIPGVLLAPSLPLIVYAVVARQAAPGQGIGVDTLFLAGVLPALLMIILLAGWSVLLTRHAKRPRPVPQTAPRPPILASLKAVALDLPLPAVVLGGIYGGWLLVAEAAVISAAWVLVAVVIIRRDIGWGRLVGITAEASVLTGAAIIVLGLSMASTNLMIDAQLPQRLFAWIEPLIHSGPVLLLAVSLVAVLVGTAINIFAAVAILAPLIIPVGVAFGVNPVHLGIVLLVSLQIGSSLAPSSPAGRDSNADNPALTRTTWPLMAWLIIALVIIACWPALSVWLPG